MSSASAAMPPPPSPQEAANLLLGAADLHERQLSELRERPAELAFLQRASIGQPLAGYRAISTQLSERDRFLSAMLDICNRVPQTGHEYVSFPGSPPPSSPLLQFCLIFSLPVFSIPGKSCST
jgi:hypothetical protein